MDSVKELGNKVKRLEAKLSKSQAENRKMRERLKTVRKSRAKWKAKSQSNGLRIRVLSKSSPGIGERVARHRYELWLMCFCVSLRLFAGCSYRSIAKILTLSYLRLQLEKGGRPCANTVENWVKKLGYFQQEIRGTEGLSGDLCLIMDESMCVVLLCYFRNLSISACRC